VSANDPAWDEQQWKRPAGGDPGSPGGFPVPPGATNANPGPGGPMPGATGDSAWSRGAAAGEPPAYSGPPRPAPGSAATRPPTVIRTAPARKLPEQDIAGLDADERQARTMTYGVGMITGAVALLILFVLCGRILF